VIGSLRGVALEVGADGEVLVEVGGVGYRVLVPTPDLVQLTPGAPLFLHVSTQVREDAIVLYGFLEKEERRCFEALLSVHGVGPALALAVLSVHSPAVLRRVVATSDAEALALVPGIGRKTAARLLLDLAPRLGQAPLGDVASVGPDGAGPLGEVKAALTELGYGADEVREALRHLPDEGESERARPEDLLRAALRQLAGAR
jgi:Holliday junction DNA helicase RuvA